MTKLSQLERHIYCYYWAYTAIPAYVGSAFDVAVRDKQHCDEKRTSIPFDKVIVRHGRDAFLLKVVETVNAITRINAMRQAALRENFWMIKLRTWHKFGGYNFMRASAAFSSESHMEAATAARRRAWDSDPEWRERTSLRTKKMWADKKFGLRAQQKYNPADIHPEVLKLWKEQDFRRCAAGMGLSFVNLPFGFNRINMLPHPAI